MIRAITVLVAIFTVAVLMSMVGRGGGNFYVPILVGSKVDMHEAATTSQLILAATAVAAGLVFGKHNMVDWKLALVIDPPTDIMAFVGGFYASRFTGSTLKLTFGVLLMVATVLMLVPLEKRVGNNKPRLGFWHRKFGNYEYRVNLWLALPITAATGLFAGMVGCSGGSFKVPLMVLMCNVPMHVAVGTSSIMIAATALMGFSGHALAGDFNPGMGVPSAAIAVAGGLIGGRLSLRTDPKKLKRLFAYTTLAASAFMIYNAVTSTG